MKLSAVNLRTARLPEMVSFYRDLLGLPCQERAPGRWEVQVGEICLALVQGGNVPPPDPENCLLEFLVEDADKEYRRIAEQEGAERAACDYISGMSDRYAVSLCEELLIPKFWQL